MLRKMRNKVEAAFGQKVLRKMRNKVEAAFGQKVLITEMRCRSIPNQRRSHHVKKVYVTKVRIHRGSDDVLDLTIKTEGYTCPYDIIMSKLQLVM